MALLSCHMVPHRWSTATYSSYNFGTICTVLHKKNTHKNTFTAFFPFKFSSQQPISSFSSVNIFQQLATRIIIFGGKSDREWKQAWRPLDSCLAVDGINNFANSLSRSMGGGERERVVNTSPPLIHTLTTLCFKCVHVNENFLRISLAIFDKNIKF